MYRRQFIKGALVGSVALIVGQASGLGRVAAQNGDQQRTVNIDRLNLRSGAGLGYRVVTVLKRGDIVSIAGPTKWADGYEWVQVAVWNSPTGGWVASKYFSTGGGSYPRDRVRVSRGPLRVRSKPSLSGSVRSTAPVGAYATVLDENVVRADGYTWIYVQLDSNGVVGWMAMEFLAYIDVA